MSKTNKLPKKYRPKDLRRITNKKCERVWVTGGKEYPSLQAVNDALKLYQPD